MAFLFRTCTHTRWQSSHTSSTAACNQAKRRRPVKPNTEPASEEARCPDADPWHSLSAFSASYGSNVAAPPWPCYDDETTAELCPSLTPQFNSYSHKSPDPSTTDISMCSPQTTPHPALLLSAASWTSLFPLTRPCLSICQLQMFTSGWGDERTCAAEITCIENTWFLGYIRTKIKVTLLDHKICLGLSWPQINYAHYLSSVSCGNSWCTTTE